MTATMLRAGRVRVTRTELVAEVPVRFAPQPRGIPGRLFHEEGASFARQSRCSAIPAHMESSMADIEKEESLDLIASNKVEGTAVYNPQGDKLGSIYNFMVNKFTGHVE